MIITCGDRSPNLVVTGAAPHGLPAQRHPVLGAAVPVGDDELGGLRQLLRRQLRHHGLPAVGRYRVPRSGQIVDDGTVNAGVGLQSHSMEDGVFKSDHVVIGSGVSLGAGSFVHYGVTIGDGAVLAPDSFVMKGTEVPTRARWQGNPAREVAVAEPVKVPMRI